MYDDCMELEADVGVATDECVRPASPNSGQAVVDAVTEGLYPTCL